MQPPLSNREPIVDIDFQTLENRLDQLLTTHQQLRADSVALQQSREENAQLRSQIEMLNAKLEHARSRVEAVMHRLQALEQGA